MTLQFLKTDAKNEDFIKLVALLDTDLATRDGADHSFYHQFNGIDRLEYCLVAYYNHRAVGCGALKTFDPTTLEVKRMYVLPDFRGKGIATKVLTALEVWTKALGFHHCLLETGKRQPEAIALYQKNGYVIVPNYPPYEGVQNSLCFRKTVHGQTNKNS